MILPVPALVCLVNILVRHFYTIEKYLGKLFPIGTSEGRAVRLDSISDIFGYLW